MTKTLTMLYNGFLWSLLIALFCFDNVWLQMRVNVGYIFFGLWVLLSILGYLIFRHKTPGSRRWLTLISLIVCLGVALFKVGPQRLLVVPAAFIREGLHQNSLPFMIVNLVLGLILILGAWLGLKKQNNIQN